MAALVAFVSKPHGPQTQHFTDSPSLDPTPDDEPALFLPLDRAKCQPANLDDILHDHFLLLIDYSPKLPSMRLLRLITAALLIAVLTIQGATASTMKLCQSDLMAHGSNMAMILDYEPADSVAHNTSHDDPHGDRRMSNGSNSNQVGLDIDTQSEMNGHLTHHCTGSSACCEVTISQRSHQAPPADRHESNILIYSVTFSSHTPPTLDRPPRA